MICPGFTEVSPTLSVRASPRCVSALLPAFPVLRPRSSHGGTLPLPCPAFQVPNKLRELLSPSPLTLTLPCPTSQVPNKLREPLVVPTNVFLDSQLRQLLKVVPVRQVRPLSMAAAQGGASAAGEVRDNQRPSGHTPDPSVPTLHLAETAEQPLGGGHSGMVAL